MCQGDDPSCSEFEQHRLRLRSDLARERRSFLKSTFVATGAAAGMASGALSLVTPALAQTTASRQSGQPQFHYLPANAETVHWGYFSKLLRPQVEIDSGDYVTIE